MCVAGNLNLRGAVMVIFVTLQIFQPWGSFCQWFNYSVDHTGGWVTIWEISTLRETRNRLRFNYSTDQGRDSLSIEPWTSHTQNSLSWKIPHQKSETSTENIALEDAFATRTGQIDLLYFKMMKCFRNFTNWLKKVVLKIKGRLNLIRRPYSVFLWLFQRANIWWWCPSGPQVTKSYRFLHFITRQTDTHGSSQSTLAQNHIKCALDLKTMIIVHDQANGEDLIC